MQNNPIGIFDSGFGGLTVMKAVNEILPNESILYFGDTCNLPYGNKSKESVIRFTLESSHFLLEKQIKMLIVACHTASCLTLEILQEVLPIPVFGVSVALVEDLLSLKRKNHVAILSTQATIASRVYQKLISEQDPSIQMTSIPCPLFVPLVEEGFVSHPATKLIAMEYLHPIANKVDAVLFGCTHYPLLKEVIQDVVGKPTQLIDPSYACAIQVKEFLDRNPQMRSSESSYRFFVTDNSSKFQSIGPKFLGKEIPSVELVSPSQYSHEALPLSFIS